MVDFRQTHPSPIFYTHPGQDRLAYLVHCLPFIVQAWPDLESDGMGPFRRPGNVETKFRKKGLTADKIR
jgi:hypothetical protein